MINMPRKMEYILLILALVFFILQNEESVPIVNRLFIIISSLLWIVGFSHLPDKVINIVSKYVSSVFFIYAIHNTFVLANTSKILLWLVDEKVCYWISPLITMMLCMAAYFLLKRYYRDLQHLFVEEEYNVSIVYGKNMFIMRGLMP